MIFFSVPLAFIREMSSTVARSRIGADAHGGVSMTILHGDVCMA